MKTITIPGSLFFNEADETFIETTTTSIDIEHSLFAISKWESKWHLPFFGEGKKTHEQMIDYVRCMTLTPNVDPNVYYFIPSQSFEEITSYIEDSMSSIDWAKVKTNGNQKVYGKPKHDNITSELIYFWMVDSGIPFECQYWHVSKLLSLIRMCNLKRTPPKKMSKHDLLARNASLNAARRKALNTTG